MCWAPPKPLEMPSIPLDTYVWRTPLQWKELTILFYLFLGISLNLTDPKAVYL